RNFLRDNADICNEIEKKIKEKLGVGPRLDNDPAAAVAPAPAPAPFAAGPVGTEARPPAGPAGPAGPGD
ncbi:MAG TPA: DNA recombination/repair protein RecA, partial [Trebonia sp.]|nr:DNA recombination/repair protein RecA [Trebonia sp.]